MKLGALGKVMSSNKFLFGLGIVGIGFTVGAAVVGTLVAKDHIEEAEEAKGRMLREDLDDPQPVDCELTKMEVVKVVWKDFVPLAGAVTLTTLSFVKLFTKVTRLDRENLALHGLLTMSEATVQRLESHMIEQIGEKKATKIVNDVQNEVIESSGDPIREIVPQNSVKYIGQDGEELICFCDIWSKRTFKASKFRISRALENLNLELRDYGEATLNHFYEELGLDDSDAGDLVGWRADSMNDYKVDILWDTNWAGAYVDPEGRSWTYLRFTKTPELLPME